jgi:type VI secretion system Hcp family effector
MRKRSLGFGVPAVCLFVTIVGFSAQPAWAFKGVAFITGTTQGVIRGDSTAKGTEGGIDLLGISASITVPLDASGGSTTGQIQPKPFGIVKSPDRATTRLLLALFANESLKVEIRLFRPDKLGVPVLYHIITLGPGAKISGFNTAGDPNVAGGVVESVEFAYPSATFEDKVTGAVATFSLFP